MPLPLRSLLPPLSIAVALALSSSGYGQRRAGAGAPPSLDPAYALLAHQPTSAEITATLDRVLAYVDSATPARLVDRQTQQEITDFTSPHPNAAFERDAGHPFIIVSYEWGVTYAAMLSAAEATGDSRFSDFVARRFALIGHALPLFRAQPAGNGPPFRNALRGLIEPHALDDIGAMDAALIKARLAGVG